MVSNKLTELLETLYFIFFFEEEENYMILFYDLLESLPQLYCNFSSRAGAVH